MVTPYVKMLSDAAWWIAVGLGCAWFLASQRKMTLILYTSVLHFDYFHKDLFWVYTVFFKVLMRDAQDFDVIE